MAFTLTRTPVAPAAAQRSNQLGRRGAGAGRGGAARAPQAIVEGKNWMLQAPGISEPMDFFDPANYADGRTFSEARRFREAELTHGRVAMLACLGWVVAEQWHPLFGGGITGPAYSHFQKVEEIFPQFWELILFAIGLCEAYRISVGWAKPKLALKGDVIDPDYTPGDLGFDPLGLFPDDADEQAALKTKELNNGRLAMISIAAYAAQEAVNQKTIVDTLQGIIGK